MCLFISILVEGITKEYAKEIIAAIPKQDRLTVEMGPCRRWFRKVPPALNLSQDGACACSLLTDQADWNAPYWDLLDEFLVPLENTVRDIQRLASADLSLEAFWVGDEAEETKELSIDEVCELIRANRVGTKTRYSIRSSVNV